MKAVVMEGVKQPLTVRDFPEPEPGPRDALVRVEACGVCRSDWHLWQGDLSWVGFELPSPVVLGHEWAGHRGGRRLAGGAHPARDAGC